MYPGKVTFVLDRPQSADNLGAAARVLMNFGLERLSVVAPPSWAGPPRSGGPGTAAEDVLRRARTLARKASALLDGAEIHRDLAAAVAGATWVCGTSSRSIEGRPRLSPRALAAEVHARAAAGQVALVFGQERRGLSDAELELCHAVCTIPTAPAYDSMNLAQAVAVVAYELAAGAPPEAGGAGPGAGKLPPGAPRARGDEPARHATVEALWARLRALLSGAGFLNPQNPEHILADFRRLLARAEPTQREVELLVGAARALERELRERAPPPAGD
jgi:tRNA/rRNA methyltransferase